MKKSFQFSVETVLQAKEFLDRVDKYVISSPSNDNRNSTSSKNLLMQSDHISDQHSYTPQVVCMAVRRGDKVGLNASYIYEKWALSSDYYLAAIQYFRKKYLKITLVTFTGGGLQGVGAKEDRQWTEENIRQRFHNSKSVTVFADTTDDVADNHILSLAILSLCPNIIVASSSFSWWAAYLSGHDNVVAPRYLHSLGVPFEPDDYYLPGWTLLEPAAVASVVSATTSMQRGKRRGVRGKHLHS